MMVEWWWNDPKMRMVFSYTCSLDDPWVGYIGCHFSSSSSTSSSVHLAIIKNDDAWYGRNRGRHIYKPCSLDWPEARLYRAPLFLHLLHLLHLLLLLTVIRASSSCRSWLLNEWDGWCLWRSTLSWNRIFSEICYIICWACTRTWMCWTCIWWTWRWRWIRNVYPCSLDDPWVGYIGFHYSSSTSSSSSSSVHLAN